MSTLAALWTSRTAIPRSSLSATAFLPTRSQRELLPFMIAGIRELFEESGLLLAYDKNGLPFSSCEQAVKERVSRYRGLLNERKTTLKDVLKKEGLFLALDQLHHYAHWITPEARTLRFDTHFFVARYPGGQQASADLTETTEGAWMSPTRGPRREPVPRNLVLSPPTLKTLEDLSRFKTVEDVISFSKTCDKPPILSLLLSISDDWFLVFPWDPEFQSLGKGEIPLCPDHGRVSTLSDNTTRICTREGCNIPYCKE